MIIDLEDGGFDDFEIIIITMNPSTYYFILCKICLSITKIHKLNTISIL